MPEGQDAGYKDKDAEIEPMNGYEGFSIRSYKNGDHYCAYFYHQEIGIVGLPMYVKTRELAKSRLLKEIGVWVTPTIKQLKEASQQ